MTHMYVNLSFERSSIRNPPRNSDLGTLQGSTQGMR